ncbi:carboxylesterase family protein, partial [Acinetobacter baumannii]
PTGTRRWQPPAAAPGWSGVRQATSFGSICPQTQDKAVVGAEDCLFLNVWTPQTTAGSPTRRPVMVFIHGGAFIEGAGSLPVYDGSALSANG